MAKLLSACVACAFAVTGAANAASIVNGGFEDVDIGASPWLSVTAGGTDVTGWVVGGDGVDMVSNAFYDPAEGTQSIDLNRVTSGSVSQAITGLNIGSSYEISFQISGNPGWARIVRMAASIDGDVKGAYSFDTGRNPAADDMIWDSHSFAFTATSTTQTLMFASTVAGTVGMGLDNVEIAAVPLPAAGMMLLAGLGGIVALRRRKSS